MKLLTPYLTLILWILSTPTFASDSWTQRASFGGEARHRCTGFALGNKGYIGGGHINSGTLVWHKDWWQYDPGTDSWTQIADYGGGYHYHSVAFTIGTCGYVGLGETDGSVYSNAFWKYIPQVNIWEPIPNFPGTARRGASSFVINDQAYVGLGQTDAGYAVDFYRFNPATNNWYQIADFIGEARSSAVGFSNNGKGYIGTGHIWGDDVRDFYEYDPSTNSWTQKADVGDIDRQDATGFVINGYAYIGTGNDVAGDENYKDFWRYDFNSDTWIQVDDFGGQGRRYMVSFVINDIAYCGTGTDGTNFRDFWSFNPLLNGLNKVDYVTISTFPNPVIDEFTIDLNDTDFANENIHLILCNMSGQYAYTQHLDKATTVIQRNGLESGNYLLLIEQGGKIIYSEKLILN